MPASSHRGHRLVLMDRHGDDAAGEAGEILQEAGVLGRHHADDQHERPRHPLLEIGERRRDGAAAVGIVAAVEPELALRRQQRRQPALRQPLHARRPIDADHAGLEGGARKLQAAARKRRNRGAGILELMPAVKLWRRQIEQARHRPDKRAGRAPRSRSSPRRRWKRRAQPRRLPLDHGQRLARLLGTTAGTPRLRMPAFSAAIFSIACRRETRDDRATAA
jgi:hypothetical protein